MAELVDGPIDVERLLAEAARPDCGAIALFLGTTRDERGRREVVRLHYEAHRPMALAALEKIERDAAGLFPVTDCRIVHRLGDVPPAQAGVAIVVTATHRAPAFDACRWAIDELKSIVPIWKKEYYAGGGEEWAGGRKL